MVIGDSNYNRASNRSAAKVNIKNAKSGVKSKEFNDNRNKFKTDSGRSSLIPMVQPLQKAIQKRSSTALRNENTRKQSRFILVKCEQISKKFKPAFPLKRGCGKTASSPRLNNK